MQKVVDEGDENKLARKFTFNSQASTEPLLVEKDPVELRAAASKHKQNSKRRLKKLPPRMRMHDPSQLFEESGSKSVLQSVSKQKEECFERKCSICLENIRERSQPVSCKHIYCLECISDWAKYTNACPLCKITMTQLKVFNCAEDEDKFELIEVKIPMKDD